MKIMIDVNIVLDMIQKRHPHYQYSSTVLSEVLYQRIQGVLPGHGMTTIYYLVARHDTPQKANESIDWLLANFDIISTDNALFQRARCLPFDDFEDAVVAVSAEVAACDYIVTRNMPDFEHSPIPAITPEEFVNTYVMRPNNMSRRGR